MKTIAPLLTSALISIFVVAYGGCSSGTTSQNPLSKLYIAGGFVPAMYVYDSATTANGTDAPDRTITGPNTQLFTNFGIDYDENTDSIYLGVFDSLSVLIWDNVSTTNGDTAPDRVLAGATTGIIRAQDANVDSTRNLLYVSGPQGVLVYANASTVNGDIAPTRTIAGATTTFSGDIELRMALDESSDRMYIVDPNRTPSAVLVFDHVSTLNGDVAPDRIIAGSNTNFFYPWGVAIDTQTNTLYIGDQLGFINVFANASTATGNIAPTRIITGPTSTIAGISDTFVDESADTLYATDATGDQILVWENASTVDGDIAPTRALTAGFNYPGGLIGAP